MTPTGEAEYSQTRKDAAKESGSAECSRIEISPTANGGFSVQKYYRSKDSGKGPSTYREPDTYAFSTFQELSSFLQDAFGQSAPADSVDTEGADDM